MQLVKQNFVQTLILVVVILSLFWVREWSIEANYFGVPRQAFMPLGCTITEFFEAHKWLSFIVTSLLMVFNSYLLTRITIRNLIFAGNSYFVSVLFIAIYSAIPLGRFAPTMSIVVYLMLLSMGALLGVYRQRFTSYKFFVAGATASLAALIYAPSLAMVLAVLLAPLVFGELSVRGVISLLLAFAIPIFALNYIYWLTDNIYSVPFDRLVSVIDMQGSLFNFSVVMTQLPYFIFVALMFVLGCYSLWYYYAKMGSKRTKGPRTVVLLSQVAFTLLGVLVVYPHLVTTIVPLLSLPITALAATVLRNYRSDLVANLIFIAILLLVGLLNFADLIF